MPALLPPDSPPAMTLLGTNVGEEDGDAVLVAVSEIVTVIVGVEVKLE